MDIFVTVTVFLAIPYLVWSCIEVGCNDAANLVNAVFGARVLNRRVAVLVAGLFVVLGASFSSPVLETVRKGIIDMQLFDSQMALSVFITCYIIGTVLLYVYSQYGMPVSTTATLVFSLAGGAIGVGGALDVVNWGKFWTVVSAILVSILTSGFAAFFAQRIFRGAIRKDCQNHERVLLHGPWIAGFIFTSLFWFMIVKGMRYVEPISQFKDTALSDFGLGPVVASLWFAFTMLTFVILKVLGPLGSRYLFHATAVLGMACMAFAFGQNDLANCASPGIASIMIWNQGFSQSLKISVPLWGLTLCGFLIFLGMLTKRAQRVTRAEINTASQQKKVKLYSPEWCISLARALVHSGPKKDKTKTLAPKGKRNADGKKFHYDSLRASVILAVSACVIAFASGLGLPVSTTYVAFAAVVASGWGDRVFVKGDSHVKIGRSIWVVTGWFMGAAVAFFSCALFAFIIYKFKVSGLVFSLLFSLGVRQYFHRKGDMHEVLYHSSKSESSDEDKSSADYFEESMENSSV